MRVARTWVWGCGLMLAGVGCSPGLMGEDEDGDVSEGSTSSSTSSGGSDDTAASPMASETEGSSGGPEVDSGGSDESGESGESDEPPAAPACGDGVVDPYEECDDGNNVDDDECNNDCVPTAAIVWDALVPTGDYGACANAIAVSPTGQIGVGGRSQVIRESVNAWIGMLADDGAVQWEDHWDGGQQEPDRVMAVAFDGAGALYVAATEQNGFESNQSSAWLYKRGADGSTLWSAVMENPPGGSNSAADVVVGPDDGATLMAKSTPRLRLQRYTPAGDLAWPGSPLFVEDVGAINDSQLRQDAAGNLYVVGVYEDHAPGPTRHAFVERYSLDGILQWSVESNPPTASSNVGDRIVVGATRADGYTSLALRDVFASDDLVVRSWDSEGLGPDVTQPGFDREIRFTDAAFDSMGNLIVVGNSNAYGAWVIKLDPAGALVWTRRAADHENNGVAVAANDDVLVAGCDESGEDPQVWVRRYAP